MCPGAGRGGGSDAPSCLESSQTRGQRTGSVCVCVCVSVCVRVCMCVYVFVGGRENLVVRGLCPQFVVHGVQMCIGSTCDSPSLPDVYTCTCIFLLYIHTATFTWLHRYTSKINVSVHVHYLGPWSSSIWSSGKFPVSQAWAVCFGLFKLPTHSSTQDRARPLHLW